MSSNIVQTHASAANVQAAGSLASFLESIRQLDQVVTARVDAVKRETPSAPPKPAGVPR